MAGDNQKMIDNFNNMSNTKLENIIANYYENISDEYEEQAIKIAERILKERGVEKPKPEIKIEDSTREVHLTGINMPFIDMVIFMVKWGIATIPAFIILFIIGFIVAGILGIGAVSLFK